MILPLARDLANLLSPIAFYNWEDDTCYREHLENRKSYIKYFRDIFNMIKLEPNSTENHIQFYESVKMLIDTDEFDNIKLTYNNVLNTLLDTYFDEYVDFTKYKTADELKSIGFGNWDEHLLLCPHFLCKRIKIGTEFIDINNEVYIWPESNQDIEARFGCLAYGFKV